MSLQQYKLKALMNVEASVMPKYLSSYNIFLIQYGQYNSRLQKTVWLSLVHSAYVDACYVSSVEGNAVHAIYEMGYIQPFYICHIGGSEYEIMGFIFKDGLKYDRIRFMKHNETPFITQEEFDQYFGDKGLSSKEIYSMLKYRKIPGIKSSTTKGKMREILLKYIQ